MSWPTCATCCVAPCVCGTNVPFRHSFPATITWHPLAPFHLPDEDVERIAKRVVELMAERKAKPACDHQWLADNGRVGNYHCALCGVPGYRNFTGSVVERR